MSRSHSRLATIIGLRQRQRDAAAASYQDALAAHAKLQSQIDALRQEHAAQLPVQATSSLGTVNTQRLIESHRYQLHLLQQVEAIGSQMRLVAAECEKRRLNLVAKEQAVRALEKLQDKQRAAAVALEIGRQQETLDQFASFRHWQGT